MNKTLRFAFLAKLNKLRFINQSICFILVRLFFCHFRGIHENPFIFYRVSVGYVILARDPAVSSISICYYFRLFFLLDKGIRNMEINGKCDFPKRMLVTGGAGYLGSTLVPMLLQSGHEVVVYDKFQWGAIPLLPHAANPRLEIVRGDILDKDLLAKHMLDCDAIIHLAAIVGYPACEKFQDKAVEV